MNNTKKIEDTLIEEINLALKNFNNFEKAKINLQGDIIIKRKDTLKRSVDTSILTDVFKQIISNDIKKNRV
jgi:hypothetical protein